MTKLARKVRKKSLQHGLYQTVLSMVTSTVKGKNMSMNYGNTLKLTFMGTVVSVNALKMSNVMSILQTTICFIYLLKIPCVQTMLLKSFSPPLTHNIVPVVLGGANYSQHAPPNSYINARDFSSPKALADYLKYLQSNTSAYKEYFEWKKYFEVFETFHRNLSLYQDRAMCQLCEALNEETQVTKIHGDINHWWRKEGDCKIQGTFPWSNFQSQRMFNSRSIVYVLYSLLFSFAVFHCYLKTQKFQISTCKNLHNKSAV